MSEVHSGSTSGPQPRATSAEARPVPVPRWLYWLTLVLILAVPGPTIYAVDRKHGPFIGLADVVAGLVGVVFVLWVLVGGAPAAGADGASTPSALSRRLARVTWPPLPFWAWLVVAILSAAGAESLTAAAMEIVQLGLYFGVIYMLFANVLIDTSRQRQAVRVLLLATTVALLFGLVQYVQATSSNQVFRSLDRNADEVITADEMPFAGAGRGEQLAARLKQADTNKDGQVTQEEFGAGPQRVRAFFQSRSAYSGFLALVLPLFFGLTLWSELSWERYWSAALIVLGGLTILAPPVIWVLAVVLIVMSATWSRSVLTAKVALAAVAFMAVTLTCAPLNRQVLRETLNPYEEGPIYKLMLTEGEDAAQQGPLVKKRWIEWLPALNMLGDRFVFGVGAGNYQLGIGQYYGYLPNVKKTEPDTNNLYLVTAGSMGFAGLICLVAFLGYFWRLAGNLWMHGQGPWDRALACGLYGACLALLTVNLFTSVFVRGTALAWALIIGLIMARAHERTAA